jgi:nitroimidazol reductase NimA-like FMN-containing flavoprotein (pyridoxamine 5'-phosphate oxidase superfamily)
MVDQGYSLKRTTLPRAICLELLSQSPLARVVISVRCLPAALPARIAVIGDDHLLVASSEGSVILAAKRRDVISVQVDGLETGGDIWSVMASGLASPTTDAEDLPVAMRESLALGANLISLPLTVVVGQRIG